VPHLRDGFIVAKVGIARVARSPLLLLVLGVILSACAKHPDEPTDHQYRISFPTRMPKQKGGPKASFFILTTKSRYSFS